jgi:hypothetical protein
MKSFRRCLIFLDPSLRVIGGKFSEITTQVDSLSLRLRSKAQLYQEVVSLLSDT